MTNWIDGLISEWGSLGVAFLMLLENVFPPIPSEIVMPMAGLVAARGEASLLAVIIAGTLGSLAGATFWFVAGRAFSLERLRRMAAGKRGRWLTVGPRDIDRAQDWFERWGRFAVLFGRLVPGIRTLISVPAGLSRMRWSTFLIFSGAGSLLWVTALTLAGYWLGGEPQLVNAYISPIGNVVIAGLVVLYLWRVATFKADAGQRSAERSSDARVE